MTIDGEEYWTEQTAKVEEADGQIEITSAEATKVNEITVTFAAPVDSENVTLVVTKGASTIAIESTEWNLDEDEAIITTTANMANGTYTLTATNTETEDEYSIDFEVKKQDVDRIEILNDIALTNKTAQDPKDVHKEAYAYYDVFDQYNESVRTSKTIQWTGSCNVDVDKPTGRLTLTKSDDNAWVYGDKIYLTGVYTKTGVTVQKELTVGTEQALNSIEMKGFVKKGDSEIIQDLPADFKEGEYYLLFNALDQNKCALKADSVLGTDVTFVSDNVLVVKELPNTGKDELTIEGVDYNTVPVTPGIKVADGGEVNVTAIANNTGKKTYLNFRVGEDPVVDKFFLDSPSGVVADGDQNVVIPFEAYDAKGNAITNFRTLAKQETFNKISFSASPGILVLQETNEGTAKLTWSDKAMPWSDPDTTNDIDRPVSLTAIVVGGTGDTEMFSVQDKRRPVAISKVDADSVYVEGSDIKFTMPGSFRFIDQYDALIDTDGDATDFGDDNGFFTADADNELKGTDFAAHHFGVRVTYAGSGGIIPGAPTNGITNTNGNNYQVVLEGPKTGDAAFDISNNRTATNIQSVANNEGFKFDIVSIKDADYGNPGPAATAKAELWDSVSPAKFFGMTVVDITQVKNFTITDLGMVYIGAIAKTTTTASGAAITTGGGTGDGVWEGDIDALRNGTGEGAAFGTFTPDISAIGGVDYSKKVEVKGKYNDSSVTIPVEYMDYTSDKLVFNAATANKNQIIKAKNDGDTPVVPSDLYDKTSPVGAAKPGEANIKAQIKKIYSDESNYKTTAEIKYKDAKILPSAVTANPADETGLVKEVTINPNTVYASKDALTNLITAANSRLTDLKNAQIAKGDANNVVAKITLNDVTDLVGKAKLTPTGDGPVYDAATAKASFSDQAPKAAKIVGLAESYTLEPTTTNIAGFVAPLKITNAVVKGKVYVVDQYGVALKDATTKMTFKVTDAAETKEGYADNNFKVSGNDTNAATINGAERGDTFTLVLTYGSISATTKVTVGADTNAKISSDAGNVYIDTLIGTANSRGLEQQRIAGLG